MAVEPCLEQSWAPLPSLGVGGKLKVWKWEQVMCCSRRTAAKLEEKEKRRPWCSEIKKWWGRAKVTNSKCQIN